MSFHVHWAESAELDAHVDGVLARLRRYPAGFEDTPWALAALSQGDRPSVQAVV